MVADVACILVLQAGKASSQQRRAAEHDHGERDLRSDERAARGPAPTRLAA